MREGRYGEDRAPAPHESQGRPDEEHQEDGERRHRVDGPIGAVQVPAGVAAIVLHTSLLRRGQHICCFPRRPDGCKEALPKGRANRTADDPGVV
jgi:hypothetical protein